MLKRLFAPWIENRQLRAERNDLADRLSQQIVNHWGEISMLHGEIDRLRAKNRELNRRCQCAEAAARRNVYDCLREGISMGRALSHFAARDARRCLAWLVGAVKNGESTSEALADAEHVLRGDAVPARARQEAIPYD